MDIAAQELNRARSPFACGVADKADQISALWTGRSDAVPRTMRRGERSGHGFTGGQMRWHLRQAMQSPQPRCHRQSSAMPREQIRPLRHETSWVRCHEGALRTQRRKAAAGRYEERRGKAAPGTHPSLRDCGPKRKRRPHNADAFA